MQERQSVPNQQPTFKFKSERERACGIRSRLVCRGIAGAFVLGTVLCRALPLQAQDEAARLANVFPAGSFDSVHLNGTLPRGWWSQIPEKVGMEQDGDNRFIALTNGTPNGRNFIMGRLKLEPGWKKLLVSTRLAAKSLKAGTPKAPKENVEAGLLLRFEDDKGELVGKYPGSLLLTQDVEWKIMEKEAVVPDGATHLAFRCGLFCYSGEMGIDDIKVFVLDPLPATAGK